MVVDRDLAPNLIGEPLEPLARVRQLVGGKSGSMVREVTRQLNHLVEQLPEGDVPATLAGRLRH